MGRWRGRKLVESEAAGDCICSIMVERMRIIGSAL